MPILSALSSALPYLSAAWQVGSQFLNKPKKSDYVPTGSMYNRYLAHLKSKTAESTVFHQRMRPALRQIGQQTQRGQRQVGQFVSQRKPGGGVEAQMRMGINRQALEAIGIASEKASVAQERVNEQTGEQLLKIGVQEEQALQRYQTAKKDFTKRLFATTAKAGIDLSNTLVKKHIADTKLKLDAAKDAKEAANAFTASYESAKADLTIPQDTTPEQYQDMIETADYTDPDAYNKYLKSIGAQEAKDIKITGEEEAKRIEGDSVETLRQLTETLERLPDPKQAYVEYDKIKHLMLPKDRRTAISKIESTFPDLIHDVPIERRTAIIGTTDNLKAAGKNVTDVIVGGGTTAQITAAGNVVRRIENDNIAEIARTHKANKEIRDAKILKRDIVIDRNSFKEFFGQFYVTHRPEKTTVGEKLETRRFGRDYKKRGEAILETIDALGEKPLEPHVAQGLQRQIREFAAFVDTDNQKEQTDLKIFLAKLGTNISDDEFAEWEEKIRGMTGVTSKELSSWTLDMMKRIDAMARNERYVPDISKPRLEGF